MAIEKIDFILEDESGESHQYEVNQLPAMKSFKLLQKVMKALGNTDGGLDEIKGSEANAGAMGLALVGALGDDAVFDVVKELFGYKVMRDGKKLDPDEAFTGNMSEMVLLIKELVIINWGSLFKGKLKDMLGNFTKVA